MLCPPELGGVLYACVSACVFIGWMSCFQSRLKPPQVHVRCLHVDPVEGGARTRTHAVSGRCGCWRCFCGEASRRKRTQRAPPPPSSACEGEREREKTLKTVLNAIKQVGVCRKKSALLAEDLSHLSAVRCFQSCAYCFS